MADLLDIDLDLELEDLPVIDLSKIELGEFNLDFLVDFDLFPDFSE